MGSITKKPRAPVVQTITAPRATPTPVVATSTVEAEPIQSDAEISAEARTDSLLRRSRGRFGTIATSFRGFLNSTSNENNTQTKTLLGE